MTPGLSSTPRFPVTLNGWERVLTGALLQAVDGNSDPIRSFEITPERLAFFCEQGPELAEEAESAFRRALVADQHLPWRLQHGSQWNPGTEVPGYFSTLVLSLLVDSLMDGDYGQTNDYRTKLRQWLGVDRSFMSLRGVAVMWEELAGWLDARVNQGAPFRRLILPTVPKTWTHIGYTRHLSFPARRDLRFLVKQMQHMPNIAKDPAALIRLLDPEIDTSAVSVGLKDAFAEFRAALRSGRASVDHRFWRLVERALTSAGEQSAPLAELRMEFDEDGQRRYQLSTLAGHVSFPPEIGSAVASGALMDSPNLGPAARRGILFFQSVGLADWTASGQPPANGGGYHVALSARHERHAKISIAEWETSGTWLVTKSGVPASAVEDLLNRLGMHNVRENLISVAFTDGVRVGGAWLGVPNLLPRLSGAQGTIDVRRISIREGVDLQCTDGRLYAPAIVEGQYVFSDPDGAWSRRATFVACAEEHAELRGAIYGSPLHKEWRSGGSVATFRLSSISTDWNDSPYEHQDLVEGLYALSRSGIGEGEAISLISRVVGNRSWDFLRTLVESTFFDERLRLRWRGRAFTLGSARLELVKIGHLDGAIVSGAVPLRLEQDFKRTVALHGGTPFRRLSGSKAPPILGAIDLDAVRLAEALGWKVSYSEMVPSAKPGDGLVETDIVGEHYVPGAFWDWERGRFRVGGAAHGPVTLTRFQHPAGRDHDVYRVVGATTRTFTSRYSAILDAYAQARIPMFKHMDGRIRRIPQEGALPIEISRSVRLLAAQNGGAVENEWCYEIASRDQGWLAKLLPGLVLGLDGGGGFGKNGQSRRGRGARRAMWIDGIIEA